MSVVRIKVDPHDGDIDALVRRIAESLRDVPDGTTLRINRDTARASVGAYRLALSALDELSAAVRDYRSRLSDTHLIDVVLDEHGIELAAGGGQR